VACIDNHDQTETLTDEMFTSGSLCSDKATAETTHQETCALITGGWWQDCVTLYVPVLFAVLTGRQTGHKDTQNETKTTGSHLV